MRLSEHDWDEYVNRLKRVNDKAAQLIQEYIDKYGFDDMENLIYYAYSVSTKYGEAAATLACEMYDALAEADGLFLMPAEPAATATLVETGKAINGTLLNQYNTVPATVSRLVKQAAADTTLQNAARDGAEWAWIPMGDTCPFCITLASRGWQRHTRRTMMRGHAEHIHANCNCQYAVSFRGGSEYANVYDPGIYLEQYQNAEGAKGKDKINAMRRKQYKENKDMINAHKRAIYAKKKEIESASE